jgi:hypothetical protein
MLKGKIVSIPVSVYNLIMVDPSKFPLRPEAEMKAPAFWPFICLLEFLYSLGL